MKCVIFQLNIMTRHPSHNCKSESLILSAFYFSYMEKYILSPKLLNGYLPHGLLTTSNSGQIKTKSFNRRYVWQLLHIFRKSTNIKHASHEVTVSLALPNLQKCKIPLLFIMQIVWYPTLQSLETRRMSCVGSFYAGKRV